MQKTQVKTIVRNGIVRQPKFASVYDEFIRWTALPLTEQKSLAIPDQRSFAGRYDVKEKTISLWKRRPDFWQRVRALQHEWAKGKTSHVIESVYRSALKGNSDAQRIWLTHFDDFKEKASIETTNKLEIGVNDIRFLIEALPEPLKTKHYANLRQLLDDSSAFANARNIDESYLDSEQQFEVGSGADGLEDTIPRPAHNHAQDLSRKATHVIPGMHQESVCGDLVGQVSTYNHQSTARGG